MGISRMGLPIWKRAMLAIEPQAIIDIESNRYGIVDSATRQGLSGALTIARREGIVLSADKKQAYTHNAATRIFGIYTGRLASEDELDAQLGIVWPINYVHEILSDGVFDSFQE